MLHCLLFLSLKENWSDSVDTLHSLSCLILCWNEKEKQPRSFLHRNIPLLTNHEQTAAEKLRHTLAKLRRTGTLIGQKCPKIEVNCQVDPRFACNENLSIKKWSHKQTLVRCCVFSHMLVTFLWNRCKIEMHNAYQFSGNQVFPVVSSFQTFPEKAN